MLLHSNIVGEGEPLLILHGFLGMGDNWKTLSKKFAEQGLEVHMIDQRNHGRSFHDDEFNYDILVEDLLYYCDHYNIDECAVLGHSMGGKTAMLFAARYPYLVSKLVVADIAPRFYPKHHDDILAGLSALDFNYIKTRKEADVLLSMYVPEVAARQFLLKNLYWKERGVLGLRINLEVLVEQVGEVGEALPNHLTFDKDTLFLKGDRSEYISIQDENLIKLQFPNAKIETIPNAGHWLHAENPIAFFDSVNEFLWS